MITKLYSKKVTCCLDCPGREECDVCLEYETCIEDLDQIAPGCPLSDTDIPSLALHICELTKERDTMSERRNEALQSVEEWRDKYHELKRKK